MSVNAASHARNYRFLKWTGGVLAGLALLIVLFVAFFDWNWLRGPIARKVESATGRSFAINGDLSIRLSLHPRIIARDIVLGNAAWSRDPDMASLRVLDLTVDLLKLIGGSLVLPDVSLSAPRVLLEVGNDGVPNWIFNKNDNDRAFALPSIGALAIDHGSVVYRDSNTKTDLALELSTLPPGGNGPDSTLSIDGKGRFKGLPATLHAQGGAVLSLRNTERPYPIKASAILGSTRVSMDGHLRDPLHLRGEQLNFRIEGNDLALLFPIIGVPFPPTPAYQLAGFLDHAGDVWTFRRFKGTVGQSDLAGELAVDRSRRPQKITANMVSKKLLMQDLGGFIGADRGTKPSATPPPSDRVLPAESFSLEKLQAADADVRFRGEQIITSTLPLDNIKAHLLVSAGVLTLSPLDFGVAGGNLVSQLEMDGRKSRITVRADITARGLRLEQMFPGTKLAAADTGTMGGRAKLQGNGNSIARMLATSHGDAALIMDGGSVSELMLRLSNLDIANSIIVMLGGDRQVPVRCMVASFKATEGDFAVESLVLDTPKVNITGSGHVNFGDESLHLRLVSQGKSFSLASLRGPIAITGSFRTPRVRPELGGAVVRGGLAVALGAATAGIGALIPLLDFGKDKTSNCSTLVQQTSANAGVKPGDLAPRQKK